MAITPDEARKLLVDELAQVDRMETQIDKRLRCTGSGTLFDTQGLTRRVINELKRRYEVAGWIVSFRDDQRDGCYLYFAAPAPGPLGRW